MFNRNKVLLSFIFNIVLDLKSETYKHIFTEAKFCLCTLSYKVPRVAEEGFVETKHHQWLT